MICNSCRSVWCVWRLWTAASSRCFPFPPFPSFSFLFLRYFFAPLASLRINSIVVVWHFLAAAGFGAFGGQQPAAGAAKPGWLSVITKGNGPALIVLYLLTSIEIFSFSLWHSLGDGLVHNPLLLILLFSYHSFTGSIWWFCGRGWWIWTTFWFGVACWR